MSAARLYAHAIVVGAWSMAVLVDLGGSGVGTVKALWLLAVAVAIVVAERERARRRRDRG